MIDIHEASVDEATEIAQFARQEDQIEAMALGYKDASDGVHRAAMWSDEIWAAWSNGYPLAVFGVAPSSLLSDTGIPWMITTPRMVKHARTLMRAAPSYIALMLLKYNSLENCVHVQNRKAMQWITAMGFTIGERFILPTTRESFYIFTMKRTAQCVSSQQHLHLQQ